MTQPTTEEQARDDMASLIVNIEDFPSETLAQYARQVSLSLSKFSPNEISKLIECLCARLQSDGAKGEEAPDVAEFKSRLLSRLPGVQPSRDELFAFIDALASRPTTPEAQLAEKMPRDVHQLDEWIAEAYQEGYAEGQGDATNVHSEFCQTMWQWLDDRNLLGEPEAEPPGYTATQMMDSVYAHENALAGIIDDLQAVVRARDAKIAKATEVLKFYGERDNYAPRESDITQSWINCDDGIRARSVLAEMEGKT